MWAYLSYWFQLLGISVALGSGAVWFIAMRHGNDGRSKFVGRMAGWLAVVALAVGVVGAPANLQAAIALSLVAVIALWYQRAQLRRTRELRDHIVGERLDEVRVAELAQSFFGDLGPASPAAQDLGEQLRSAVAVEIASRATLSRGEIEQEVENQVTALRQTVARIQARLPEETTLDKIASINDAILATRLEAVEGSVKDLKDTALTRWDVAVTLFGVAGAIGTVLGILAAIVKLVAHK
jgi:hypothetical protein